MPRLVPALALLALLLAALGGPLGTTTVHGDTAVSTEAAASAPDPEVTRSEPHRDEPAAVRVAGACPRCAATPDLTQSSPALGLPHEGGSYCGAVAATNALAWLGTRGFTQLTSPRGLLAMPEHLGWKRYLRTHPRRGTLPFDLVRGLEHWVVDRGYAVETLRYAGVRDHPARHYAGLLRPDLAFLAAGLERDGVVLLHVGWYEEARPGRFARVGGHWMTLVGLEEATGTLWVHDPAPYASEGAAERIVVRELPRGRVLRPAGLGHLDARGFLELADGMALRNGRERAILDGAVALRVR